MFLYTYNDATTTCEETIYYIDNCITLDLVEHVGKALVPLPPTIAAPSADEPRRQRHQTPDGFYFNPTKKIRDPALRAHVCALHKRQTDAAYLAQRLQALHDGGTASGALWPGVSLSDAAPTPETHMVAGVLLFLAHLASQAPPVRALLDAAPDRPHNEFHIVNALLGAIRYTAKASPGADDVGGADDAAAGHTLLLKKTLQFIVTQTRHIPDMGRPGAEAPFPFLALLTHSLIDLLACTPRLTVDYQCADDDAGSDPGAAAPAHTSGYRLQGHFLDALRVAPDEPCTLAALLLAFEHELIQGADDVPLTCNQGHAMQVHSYTYGHRGPPPLLVFEAVSRQGIPRACVCAQVALGAHAYHLVSMVSVQCAGEKEVALVHETALPTETPPTSHALALVVYVRCAGALDKESGADPSEEEEEDVSDSIDDCV